MHKALIVSLLFFCELAFASAKPQLLIRMDDAGMSHSVNQAMSEVIETGIPVSVSVMVPTPWFSEAVEMLKGKDNVAVGVHLTLTSEFKEYRWGPIAGRNEVPSLVDDMGYFRHSVRGFLLSDYRLSEIETEIRAQVELALRAGLKVRYLDHHMGIARATPEIATVVEKVAKEYNVAVSRYYNEEPFDLFHYKAEEKASAFFENLKDLPLNQLNMFVMHPGRDTPELQGMLDMNSMVMRDPLSGLSTMSKHRAAELKALTDEQLAAMQSRVHFVNYNDVVQQRGLKGQKRSAIFYKSREDAAEQVKSIPVVDGY
ncbi:ChbG/HpnK family deacetylase [Teredinibacter sp. KSP-S5-2]|uniref:ChbG/HpnK family deacetylase n=1 Tax=Teredinibacter sp. KSP-S5-2 TaxID=3034506 RepID=UPI0029345C3E|nr:ChbG/HpnK family deacetylase [Teredinibacter sp. KSP-S5-2]WNO11022.1 ChbG/HpnK family deacetylase [Teredinibacter sp. KSP-S5-2]